MNIDIQYKIKNNINDLKYLREKSYWYKYLNRDKSYLKQFEEEMKKFYKITTEDKIKKMNDSLDSISRIISILS